jgi:hypothetical protein
MKAMREIVRRVHVSFLLVTVAALGLAACNMSTQAKEFEDVHRCDEFAAHPGDPGKWAPGVAEEDLVPGPAMRFCKQAVEEHPETARFHFQLGRALWAAERIEEGIESFLKAQKMEYGPAYAYLADAYQAGLVPGEEADPDFARELYEKAAEAGFKPAIELLGGSGRAARLSSGGGGGGGQYDGDREGGAGEAHGLSGTSTVSSIGAKKSLRLENPSYFKQPDWLVALHGADFETLSAAEGVNLYLEGVQEFMKPENYRMVDPTCSAVADVRLGPRLAAIRLGVGLDSSSEEMMLKGGNLLLQTILAMREDPAGYARWTAERAYLMADGERDMSTLVQTYDCVSSEVRTIYNNIGPFIDYIRKPRPTGETAQANIGGSLPPNSAGIDLEKEYEKSRQRRESSARQASNESSARRAAVPAETREAAPVRRTSARKSVTLYSDEGYGGASETLYESDPDLSDNTIGDDSVSSLKIDSGCEAVLFSRSDYRGRSRAVSQDTANLQMDWKKRIREIHRAGDDSISSIKVHCE